MRLEPGPANPALKIEVRVRASRTKILKKASELGFKCTPSDGCMMMTRESSSLVDVMTRCLALSLWFRLIRLD
jgi:hypothetical protein